MLSLPRPSAPLTFCTQLEGHNYLYVHESQISSQNCLLIAKIAAVHLAVLLVPQIGPQTHPPLPLSMFLLLNYLSECQLHLLTQARNFKAILVFLFPSFTSN